MSAPEPDVRVLGLGKPDEEENTEPRKDIRALTEADTSNIIGVNINGYIVERARIKEGEFTDSDHYGIILAKHEVTGDYVTWQFHLTGSEIPEAYWGHYFNHDDEGAFKDFDLRE